MKNSLFRKGLVCAVILLFIGIAIQPGISTNTIQNEKTDAKDLLFQTILDIANNKEVQQIISGSKIRQGGFFYQNVRLSKSTSHMFTKEYLNFVYNIGLILTKSISSSKINSLLQSYQASHQELQKEITAVIENNANLKAEMTQLSSLNCDCEKNITMNWSFPVICLILEILLGVLFSIYLFGFFVLRVFMPFIEALFTVVTVIGSILCDRTI